MKTQPQEIVFIGSDDVEHKGTLNGRTDNHGRPVYQFDDGLWVVDTLGTNTVRWPFQG